MFKLINIPLRLLNIEEKYTMSDRCVCVASIKLIAGSAFLIGVALQM